jgi:hypothetical protein
MKKARDPEDYRAAVTAAVVRSLAPHFAGRGWGEGLHPQILGLKCAR